MAKAWLEERLSVLIPALQLLGKDQEAEIERLCLEELDAWRARPSITKESALRPVVTDARSAIRKRLKLTPDNRYLNKEKGEYQHIALKYLNLDWGPLNAVEDEKFQEGLENQQVIENPRAIVARAETLLHSSRSDELIVALALVTGRRTTELLKTGRFFPKTAHTVVFDGQLKRRDLDVKPFEIPVLVDPELMLQAWRRLRGLEDCSNMENEAVIQKYSKAARETANRCFTGLIPQESERVNLFTHAFRAVYAQIAVHWFCPKTIDELVYANRILGHFQATDKKKQRDFLATLHYQHYTIDGLKGVRLSEPGIIVLEAFQHPKGDRSMTTTQDETQEQQVALETKPHKTRGTFTVKPGTYSEGLRLIEERGFQGIGAHDRLMVDLMNNDTIAHQMYALLVPLSEELRADGPIATLQALIAAYRSGGTAAAPGMAELLQEVRDEKEPIAYLQKLVKRDRDFQAAIAGRHAGTDYASLPMSELEGIKTTEAATERFRRAVDAIIAHNNAQTDPLHLWYIDAASVRKLVGGRNDAVMAYLDTRKAETDAHHTQYHLTTRQNRKNMGIEDEVVVEPGYKRPVGKPRGKKEDEDE